MKKLQVTRFKIFILFVLLTGAFFSCQKNASGPVAAGTSSLSLHLTDDPSFVFDAVFIDIAKVEVKIEDIVTRNENESESEHSSGNGSADDHGSGGNSSDDSGGTSTPGGNWVALNIRPGVYNILNFRNGIDTLLGSTSFPASQALSKVRITLGANSSVVLNGQSFPLTVNNNSIIINLHDDKVNTSGNDLHLWLDFDAGNSIKLNGNNFELHSSIKAFSREKAGGIEGRVAPAAAKAVLYAINGTDTSTAMPEREGEFKIIGLKPGTYTLLVKATANGYQSTTLTGIVVGKNEDTHAGTITLHQ